MSGPDEQSQTPFSDAGSMSLAKAAALVAQLNGAEAYAEFVSGALLTAIVLLRMRFGDERVRAILDVCMGVPVCGDESATSSSRVH